MESSSSKQPSDNASWSTVRELAEAGRWDDCLAALITLVPATRSSVLEFQRIGAEAARIIALSVPDDVSSVHDFLTLTVSRADEVCSELDVQFPEVSGPFTRMQLAIAEGSSSAYVTVAKELRDLGRPYRAILAASKSLELDRRNVAALTIRAAAYADMFDTVLASADITAAETLKAGDFMVLNVKSRIAAMEGELTESLATALRSFNQHPTKIAARQVGSRLEKLGHKSRMMNWYELAAQMPEEMPKKLTEAQQRGLERLVRESLDEVEAAREQPTSAAGQA